MLYQYQIRDVQRLLNQENLKANVRENSERALASLKYQLDAAGKSAIERKMAKRYQMVRFFGCSTP
jgi:rRNA-processing protein Efg1